MAIDLGPVGFTEGFDARRNVHAAAAGVDPLVLGTDAVTENVPASLLISNYEVLSSAANRVTHSEAEDAVLPGVQIIVGEWLQKREASFAHPEVDEQAATQAAATDRVAELAQMLNKRYRLSGFNPAGINGFELDASVELIRAHRAYSKEVAEGLTAPGVFPTVRRAEEAMPILRYIPESQRDLFLTDLGLEFGQPKSQSAEFIADQSHEHNGLFARVCALGRRALELVHFRAKRQAIGHTGIASEVDLDVPEASAQSAPDREILTSDGRHLRLISYFDIGDPAYAALTAKVVEGRLREYQRHNLLEPEAKPDEIRGPHVEFLVVVDPETGEPVASLRKIHTTGNALHVMQSYLKFEEDNAWYPEEQELGESDAQVPRGKALLLKRSANDRPVVEIAALWKDDSLDTDIKVELYKAALQTSFERNELWFMGIVQAEYGGLLRNYGKHVVHTLGRPVEVKGEGAVSDVRLRPVMVDPATYYDDMMDEIVEARGARDLQRAATRTMLLEDFLIGLDHSLLSPQTLRRLEGVNHGIFN